MTVQDIMSRVSTLYNDTDYVRVSTSMYLDFLDDALTQLVLARPDANSKVVVMQLDPGTKQTFPEDMLTLIDVYRNRGQDGITNGPPIWQVNRKDMDYFANWHADSAVEPTAVTEYAYDSKTNKLFWVSPAPGATTPIFIEFAYSYMFPQFSSLTWARALTQAIPCDESFSGAVVSYMLYRLYSTDSASTKDKAVADAYKADFYTQLGLEYKASTALNPEVGDSIVINTSTAKGA